MGEWVWEVGKLAALDGVELSLKEQERSLGLLHDSALSPEAKVSSVARSSFYQLWLVGQLQPFWG